MLSFIFFLAVIHIVLGFLLAVALEKRLVIPVVKVWSRGNSQLIKDAAERRRQEDESGSAGKPGSAGGEA